MLDLFPLVKKNMKRLTLEELKFQSTVKNLEAIKGGEVGYVEYEGKIYWYSCDENSCLPMRIQEGAMC